MIPASYYRDKIRAVDAKTEAQKIAFSPLTFQAARALLELGVLREISDSGDAGLSREEIAGQCGISVYGAGVLGEIALGMGILKLREETPAGAPPADPAPDPQTGSAAPPAGEERFVLGKIGWFLLEDELTRVNFAFTNDICYQGAFDLAESVKTGKPQGLRVFGDNWTTIYEALSSLPGRAKKSWFDFDHFYSDIAFPGALPVVFDGAGGGTPPKKLLDIGGNTAKWAISCCKYDSSVNVTIADLPGQTAVAEKNARAAGFAGRISVYPCNILDSGTTLPAGMDAVWMSQFLDCFALEQITAILAK
ncbi:MAG: class I SAM-dependent methyltransferase, partial [Treponema sp.]|nr:class I SAM-dependent methyltransferase [Treponema sp.]